MIRSVIFSALVLFAFASQAQTIDARTSPFGDLAAVQGVDISSIDEVRQAAQFALWGAYQSLNGLNSIPLNQPFTIIYPDGSSEMAVRVCSSGTACVQPIDGTRKNADGSSADGGGGGGGGDGAIGGGGGSYSPPGNGVGGSGTGTVTIGRLRPA